MADHIIGFVTGGISKTIAITSELAVGERGKASAEQRRRASEAQKQEGGSERKASEDDNGDELNMTDFQWELEEIEEKLGEPPAYDAAVSGEQNQMVLTPEQMDQLQKLPQPVIIPQRRPGARQRGFMRAYAPVLGTHAGLDQDTFMQFLGGFDQALKSAPVFDVINLACFAIGFVPHPITTAVSVAVGTASKFAQECQIRYKSNAYLDRANADIFKPRGLFAMVMTFKPDSPDDLFLSTTSDNPSKDPTQAALVRQSTATSTQQFLRRLRESSGKTTDAQMPDFAPLVHPALDQALSSNALTPTGSETKSLSLIQRKNTVVQEYLDRRTQTSFAANHPSSKYVAAMSANNPSGPDSQQGYVNRFANPDHPVNNGSIFALLSGGTFDPIGAGRVRRAENKARKRGEPPLSEQERHDALMGRKVRGRVTGTPSKSVPVLGRVLRKDVLYLLVTNLPSEEEVRAVQEMMKGGKTGGRGS